MSDWFQAPLAPKIWELVGILAACIFYGRFYLQWIVSEIRKRSVVPVAFWYMSCLGSLMLLGYAAYIRSPVGALSHCFNVVIYARNLVHIWRGEGKLSARRSLIIHGAVVLIVLAALGIGLDTWLREYEATRGHEAAHVGWIWIAIGAAGQGLFACRFLVQWIATEMRRKSVVPVAFWYFSIAASLLVAASHLQRREWVFVIGLVSTLFVYIRNLWLIRREGACPVDE